MAPKSFKIDVEQSDLDDLKKRLKQTRWTDEPPNAGWRLGTNPDYLRELVDYWQTSYDWRKQEKLLNEFPQYMIEIDGVKIHFIHQKGKGKNPKPVILTHGWPDSFYRFYKVIPMLADPAGFGAAADQSFDVVVPSVPGFGFSDRAPQNSDRTALLWEKLMSLLGFESFYAAGGDLGSTVSKSLANQFPTKVKAIHITDVGYPTGQEDWSKMSPAEQEFGKSMQNWFFAEGAFNLIQVTKPQTLGYGLNDSPVGLASWIIEKFHGWSGKPDNLDSHFSKDELITNVMIYWLTQTINCSIRTYGEEAMAGWTTGLKSGQRVEAPTGVALFPGEAPFPNEWINRKVNAQEIHRIETGGHFAALDAPEVWVGEVRNFFSRIP